MNKAENWTVKALPRAAFWNTCILIADIVYIADFKCY